GEQDQVLRALEKSPRWQLRKWRLKLYPSNRPDYAEVLLKALDDPPVQVYAVEGLLELQEAQGPDLYKRLLATPEGKKNSKLFERVRVTANAELIEPLVKLLDDSDPNVRGLALQTLKSIKAFLEEKKEWQAIVEAIKGRKKE